MFRTWKRIDIGGMSKEYVELLTGKGIYISPNAERVLAKISSGKPRTISLVRVTNAQLGLGTEPVRCRDVYVRAAKLGLQECPAEVGLALRAQVKRQRRGELLLIGMSTILVPAYVGSIRTPVLDEFCIFCLENSEKLGPALLAPDARPEAKWVVPHSWVFSKKS